MRDVSDVITGLGVVKLRAPAPEDLTALTELEDEAFGPDAWSAAGVESEVTAESRAALVAEGPHGVVGYAVTRFVGGVVDLQRVIVEERFRRRGIGTLLLSGLLDRAAHGGAERMLLEVASTNRPALSCYAQFGFDTIDRRAEYYRDGSDALVMELDISGRGAT